MLKIIEEVINVLCVIYCLDLNSRINKKMMKQMKIDFRASVQCIG